MTITPPFCVEDAFLDDIVAHPHDPSLWLILADYLDDHVDPRAELVRLTHALQYEPGHADFASRQTRLQALLAAGVKPVRPRRVLGGIEFAWIPPGEFLMGSPETEAERGDDEKQHRVTLTQPFWMGVTPVTQGQWQAVLGENPSHFARKGAGKAAVKEVSDADLERFPVERVSWEDTQEFCTRLRARLGVAATLPTEAQWEYACRAGTTSPFHFGNVLNGTQANCNGQYPYGSEKKGPYLKRPTPVGLESYPANAWGLCDLHGNVWEWCADAFREDYQKLPEENPTNVGSSDDRRVVRGGSWGYDASVCRAAFRGDFAPDYRVYFLGFRVVVALP